MADHDGSGEEPVFRAPDARGESFGPTVVGIGASAGGLAALRRFFGRVPEGSGREPARTDLRHRLACPEDDGPGFEVEAVIGSRERPERPGVRGMGERLSLPGGAPQIESSPGSGTTLFVRVPDPAAPAFPANEEESG